jgi:hypothetical protein
MFVLLAVVVPAWAGLGDLGKIKGLVDKKDNKAEKKDDSSSAKSEEKTEAQPAEPAEPTTPMNKPEDVDKGGDVKTLWSDAKVGQMVKYNTINEMAMLEEVVEVKDRVVLMKSTTFQKGKPIAKTLMYFAKFNKPAEKKTETKTDAKTTDMPDETLKINGKEVKCKVTKTEMPQEGKTITTIMWMSEDVPFGPVKMQSDSMGKMQTMREVVEFKK